MFGRKKKLFEKMLTGVDTVKMGVYVRLKSKFLREHDEDFSGLLAGAVINELFSNVPSNPQGNKFLDSNQELIKSELENLAGDEEIRHTVTQAARVRSIVQTEENPREVEANVAALEKLKDLGILISGGEIPTPEAFLQMAEEFYQASFQDTET